MAQDEPVKSKVQTRLVIRNIGLLLSGELSGRSSTPIPWWLSTARSPQSVSRKISTCEGATLVIDAKARPWLRG